MMCDCCLSGMKNIICETLFMRLTPSLALEVAVPVGRERMKSERPIWWGKVGRLKRFHWCEQTNGFASLVTTTTTASRRMIHSPISRKCLSSGYHKATPMSTQSERTLSWSVMVSERRICDLGLIDRGGIPVFCILICNLGAPET